MTRSDSDCRAVNHLFTCTTGFYILLFVVHNFLLTLTTENSLLYGLNPARVTF